MKLFIAMLFVLLGTPIVCAQQPSAVEVVKTSWTKVRINWERDPFSGPLENFDEMRSRTLNERRVAMGGGERAKRESKADAANLAKQREQKPSDYHRRHTIHRRRRRSNVVRRDDPIIDR